MRDQPPTGSAAIERSLIFLGIALLTFAGGARLTGEVQKQRDVRRFRAALLATGTPSPAGEAGEAGRGSAGKRLDTRLWSPERIKAYEESLGKDFGGPLAVLEIPKIGLEVPVLPGTDDLTLNRGVGLIEGTPRPGEIGNAGIAGHRDGFFRGLKDVGVGDAIEVTSLSGRHSYLVESIRIVSPEDVSVLDPASSPVLTLVTCYPFYFVGSAPQRYIVRAVERTAASPTGHVPIPTEVPPAGVRKEALSPRKE
jgi:sortase A